MRLGSKSLTRGVRQQLGDGKQDHPTSTEPPQMISRSELKGSAVHAATAAA